MVLSNDGVFKIEEGLPSLDARYPQVSPDFLTIAEINVPAYPSITDYEKIVFGKADQAITINLLLHKRFTMKDISELEKRVQRLEYYTTLNMLEKIALQTSIMDSNGQERFQNGFFVDPFNSHVYGATSDPQYRIAIDERNGLLRAAFVPEFVEMEFDVNSSSYANVINRGNLLTLDFEEQLFIDQPYASDGLNVSGAPIKWSGSIDVRPYKVVSTETKAQPVSTGGSDKIAQAYSSMKSITPGMSNYGWWRDPTASSDTYKIVTDSSNTRDQTSVPMETGTTITTPQGSQLQGVQNFAGERVYAFKASGLKPKIRHYLYIDNIDISELAALGEVANSSATDDSFVTKTSQWGAELVSDSRGELVAKFTIPPLFLEAGVHKISLTSKNTLSSGVSESTAIAYLTIGNYSSPPIIVDPGEPGGVISNTGPSVPVVPNTQPTQLAANFIISGNTTVNFKGSTTQNTYSLWGATLTFTDDVTLAPGTSITSYEWTIVDDSVKSKIGVLNSSYAPIWQGLQSVQLSSAKPTITGAGPKTFTFQCPPGDFVLPITLKVTDNNGKTSTITKKITVTTLDSPVTFKAPDGTLITDLDVGLIITTLSDTSDYRKYIDWKTQSFKEQVSDALKLPLLTLAGRENISIGINEGIRIIAKPNYNIPGTFSWEWRQLSPTPASRISSPFPFYSYVEATELLVLNGGTGYSNTDTIKLSNGYVDATASLITNSVGGIVDVIITSPGYFISNTNVGATTYTANSTSNNNFTLYPPSGSATNTNISVTINGVYQIGGIDFYVSGGSTLVLDTNAALNDVVSIQYGLSLIHI